MTMFEVMNRRSILRAGVAAGAGGLSIITLGPVSSSFAQAGRVLKVNTLASAAAVNVPMQAGLKSELAKIPGFASPEVRPTQKIPQIVQEVIAGGADLGDADVASTLAAAEAGADLKIIGLSYSNTSQVVVVNADKTKSLEEVAAKGGTIAINSIGDFMYVMLFGALIKRGIDPKKVNFIEIGSSGDRARALIGGRVDAVPMHIEQAAELTRRGNYQILERPWQEYGNWFSAVVITSGKWLERDENKAAAVATLKAILTSFRKTNKDYGWYKDQLGKYASSKELRAADDAFLKPVWETLTTEIAAFPDHMQTMTPDEFAKIIPAYKEAGALKGTIDLNKLIDRTYLEQANKELT
ncbi:ABC transporter substrate-binding protein [Bradyrhizobium canariense]|uniref:ABC transporter substrate-binding protein n=1 Tax=Bradyrhizobium canariense TaxID=255045 RepID=UPI001B8A3116|nr:ABC transporter substrate-binding protein [Bradyrhizobium canariense]MBR0953580.1 ABC transporter substrate-binding protein [Bradyrhizobium canariense]